MTGNAAASLPETATRDGVAPLGQGDLAARCGALFATIAEDLGTLRGVASELLAELDGFARLAGAEGAPAEPLAGISAGANDLAAALAAYLGPDAAGTVRAELAAAADFVDRIHRYALTFTAVAAISRTAAARQDDRAFGGYVRQLTETAQLIEDAARSVKARLGDLGHAFDGSEDRAAGARSALDALLPRVAAGLADDRTLSRRERQAAGRVRREAAALSDEARRRLKALVTAVQFADRQAQRMGHIDAMLETGDAHAATLAAAHLAALSDEMREVAGSLAATMRALAGVGERVRTLVSTGVLSDLIEDSIAHRSDLGEDIARHLAAIRPALSGVCAEMETATQAFGAASDTLVVLEAAAKAVALAAVNSSLSANRSGEAKGALSTLSLEVRETATRCLAAVGGTQAATNRSARTFRQGAEQVVASGSAFETAADGFRAGARAGRDRAAALDTIRARAADGAAQLMSHAASVTGLAGRIGALAGDLDRLGDRIRPAAPAGPPDPAVLARIWESYTMDDERRIHAKVFGGDLRLPPAPATAASVDDMLF